MGGELITRRPKPPGINTHPGGEKAIRYSTLAEGTYDAATTAQAETLNRHFLTRRVPSDRPYADLRKEGVREEEGNEGK